MAPVGSVVDPCPPLVLKRCGAAGKREGTLDGTARDGACDFQGPRRHFARPRRKRWF